VLEEKKTGEPLGRKHEADKKKNGTGYVGLRKKKARL